MKTLLICLLSLVSALSAFAQQQWPQFENRDTYSITHNPQFEGAISTNKRQSISRDFTTTNLVILHGLKDHSARYAGLLETFERDFPEEFSKTNVFAYDQLHHGVTGFYQNDVDKPTGMVDSISENVLYLKDFLQYVKRLYPQNKTILVGHSMGGLVAATFLNDPEASELVDQAILSAPALGMDGTLKDKINNFAALSVGSLLENAPVIPNFLPNKKFFTRNDLSVVENAKWEVKQALKLRKDELVNAGLHDFGTAKALVEGIQALYKVEQKHTIPTLIIHNEGDKVTSFIGSQNYKKAYGENVEIKALTNSFHDISGITPEVIAEEIAESVEK